MNKLLLVILALASWNTVIFAEDGSEVCSIVSEDMIELGVVLEDYNFGVRPVVKADQITLGPVQKLDLSIYQGKVILFTIFSSQCGWCLKDLEYFNEYEKQWPKDSVVMVNVAFGKEGDTSKSLYTGPQELLDFVIEDHQQREFDLKNMEFYYFSRTTHAEEQGEKSSFKIIAGINDFRWKVLIVSPPKRNSLQHYCRSKRGESAFAAILLPEMNPLKPSLKSIIVILIL